MLNKTSTSLHNNVIEHKQRSYSYLCNFSKKTTQLLMSNNFRNSDMNTYYIKKA